MINPNQKNGNLLIGGWESSVAGTGHVLQQGGGAKKNKKSIWDFPFMKLSSFL